MKEVRELVWRWQSCVVLPPLPIIRSDFESARPIAFSVDEQLVALLSRDDNMIHVCETATGKERHGLEPGLSPQAARRGLAANLVFLATASFWRSRPRTRKRHWSG